jgi:hypothetical protein
MNFLICRENSRSKRSIEHILKYPRREVGLEEKSNNEKTLVQRRSRPSLVARKNINRGRLGSFVHSLTLSQLHISKVQVWRR